MAITDAERHRLHTKLDHVLGEDDAAVLISHLPPSGWSDVARTRDLDHLEERLDTRVDHLEERLDTRVDRLEERMDARFDAVDARFDALSSSIDERFATMDARLDATLERALRGQNNRFLLTMGAMFTVATSAQALIAQLLGG
jgi:hypothetical protein